MIKSKKGKLNKRDRKSSSKSADHAQRFVKNQFAIDDNIDVCDVSDNS